MTSPHSIAPCQPAAPRKQAERTPAFDAAARGFAPAVLHRCDGGWMSAQRRPYCPTCCHRRHPLQTPSHQTRHCHLPWYRCLPLCCLSPQLLQGLRVVSVGQLSADPMVQKRSDDAASNVCAGVPSSFAFVPFVFPYPL